MLWLLYSCYPDFKLQEHFNGDWLHLQHQDKWAQWGTDIWDCHMIRTHQLFCWLTVRGRESIVYGGSGEMTLSFINFSISNVVWRVGKWRLCSAWLVVLKSASRLSPSAKQSFPIIPTSLYVFLFLFLIYGKPFNVHLMVASLNYK